MRIFSVLALTSLLSANAFAADFYECGGFADTPEYRAGINLKSGTASFFDNDTTSDMRSIDAKLLYANPPVSLMIFAGQDAASAGGLRLEFDRSRLVAALYSIDSRGHVVEMGSVPCEPAKPWD